MNKINIFLMTLGLTLLSAFSQAADQGMQIKDLGIDGENRLYDVVCSNGNSTTFFHPLRYCPSLLPRAMSSTPSTQAR